LRSTTRYLRGSVSSCRDQRPETRERAGPNLRFALPCQSSPAKATQANMGNEMGAATDREGARPHFFLPHDPQITLPQCLQWCRRWRTLKVLEHVEQTCHHHHQHHHITSSSSRYPTRSVAGSIGWPSSRRNSHISSFRGRVEGEGDSPLCSCRAAIGASNLSSAEFR
jgi:hypothetical protein